MTAEEMLRRSELFSGLTDEQVEKVASLREQVEYQAGDVIVREGDSGDSVYILGEGMVEVLVSSGSIPDVPGPPRMTSIVELGPGQSFGEMSLLDQGDRSATIRCVRDGTTVHAIPRESLLALCERDPRIGYVVMRNIASDLSFKLRHRNLRMRLEAGGEL